MSLITRKRFFISDILATKELIQEDFSSIVDNEMLEKLSSIIASRFDDLLETGSSN